MAVWVIRPAITQLHTTLPTGPTNVSTVPLLNTWTIWWNIDRASHGFSGYWNAPIFYPTDGTFAFSEPQPATLIVAPVFWATGSLIIAYKAYLILSLVLNGLVTERLCRLMKIQRLFAFTAGAMMIWLPISLRRMDVVQLVPVWGILWTWIASWRHVQQPGYRSAINAAVACAVSFAMSVHHGLFMIIVLVPCLLICAPWRRILKSWRAHCVALVASAILVGLLAVPIKTILHDHDFERSEPTVNKLSARPGHLFRLPPEALVGVPSKDRGLRLSPGWTKIALAIAGVAFGLCRRRRRSWVLFVLLLTLVSAALSLGPNLSIAGWKPWWSIADIVPGLRQARSVLRFAYLTQMAVIMLATVGLSELWLRLNHRLRMPRLASVIAAIVAFVAVAELPPPKPVIAGVPNIAKHTGWTSFLKTDANRDQPTGVVCLPFAAGNSVTDFVSTTHWMYLSTGHGLPLFNGYSGFFPTTYFDARKAFKTEGLSDHVLALFDDADVRYIVVRRRLLSPAQIAASPLARYQLTLVFEDSVGIDVYRLSAKSD